MVEIGKSLEIISFFLFNIKIKLILGDAATWLKFLLPIIPINLFYINQKKLCCTFLYIFIV